MTPPLPRQVAARIGTFTGRVWVLPILSRWLEGAGRYFVITGEPGSGKSMLSAWLAGFGPPPPAPGPSALLRSLRAAVKAAHFCVEQSGSTSARECARNLSAQLADRAPGYREALAESLPEVMQVSGSANVERAEAGSEVAGVRIGHLDLGGLSDETSFDQLVRQPLRQLYSSGYDQPVVLLVDALDEALTRAGSSVEIGLVRLLAKLADLPDPVRVAITTRPDRRVLKYYRNAQRLDLTGDSPANAQDVREFVCRRLDVDVHPDREALAARVAEAAEGNFLYASLATGELIPELSSGRPVTDQRLPRGLTGLYSAFLNRELGDDEDRWHREFSIVLGLIAVARGDGLSLAQLSAMAGFDAEPAVRRSMQYLEGELPAGPFRPFHRSFARFLLEDEGNIDYRVDAAALNRRVADRYWESCRGNWAACDEYGLRHLADHLFQAGDAGRLAALLDPDWFRARYRSSDDSYAELAADLDLVLQAIADEGREHVRAGKTAPRIGQQVRCALALTSINSIAGRLSLPALAALVRRGRWDPGRALAYARRIPEPGRRVDALIALAGAARELRDEAMAEATAFARQIGEHEERARALSSLLPYVPKTLRTEVLFAAVEAIRELSDTVLKQQQGFYQTHLVPEYTGVRARHLAALATVLAKLTPECPEEALRAAAEIDDGSERLRALAVLSARITAEPFAPGAPDTPVEGVAVGSNNLESRIGDQEQRAKAAARISCYRIEPEAIPQAGDDDMRAKAIAAMAPILPDSALPLALAMAREMHRSYRTDPLPALAKRLPPGLLAEAIRIVSTVGSPDSERALETLVLQVPGRHLGGAIAAAGEFLGPRAAFKAAIAAAGRLRADSLHSALGIVAEIADPADRAGLLAALAARLPHHLLEEMASAIEGVPVAQYLERAVELGIVQRVPDSLVPAALEALGRCASDVVVIRGIAALAPQLAERQLAEAATLVKCIRVPFGYRFTRYEAEFALARRMPEPDRSAAVLEIWGAVSSGLDFQEAIVFLADVASELPQTQRRQAFEDLIARVRGAYHRGRGYHTWNLGVRAGLIIPLLAHTPETERPVVAQAALEIIAELRNATPVQGSALDWGGLAAHLPPGMLAAAEAIDPEGYIASHLPDSMLDDGLALARAVRNRNWLFAVAKKLHPPRLLSALEAAQEIGGGRLRAELMAELAGRFAALPRQDLYTGWCDTLSGLADASRPVMLASLAGLPPVAAALGGLGTVQDLIRAIEDAGEWWP